MSTPRRTIKITMSPRVPQDSPEILNQVSEAFPKDNLDINIVDSPTLPVQEHNPIESIEPKVAKEALDSAQDALNLQDQAIKQGMTPIKSPEVTKGEAQQLRKTLFREGMRIMARAVVNRVVDFFTS